MGKRLRTWFFAILIFLVILCAVSWFQTKKSLAEYCRDTPAGTPLTEAEESARQHGYHFINYSSLGHKAFVTSGGVMGRYICVIEHDGKRVLKTTLNFND